MSDYGAQLRMNRSIQAEGTFAVVKEDMGFRQYLYRGMKKSRTTLTSCTGRSSHKSKSSGSMN